MSSRLDLGPWPQLGYAGSVIDRTAHWRTDAAVLADVAKDDRTRAYVLGSELIVLHKRGDTDLDPLFTLADAHQIGAPAETVFLGCLDGAARFAHALDPATMEALKSRNDLALIDLRSLAVRGLVDAVHLPPLAEAKALLGWHARHRFCSNCGAPTRAVDAGWRRDCPSCHGQHFPRTDPVVIMLVIDGERCLLGRSHRFATGMWSCLAGFVEPGEDIEAAVRREIREESSVVCGRVRYLFSQPWPFPSSLMIGCYTEALSREIIVDKTELDDVRWFHRDDVELMLARQHPDGFGAPQPVAIAYHLIRSWVEGGVGFD